jgi:triosephosphate isomerase (TIM)
MRAAVVAGNWKMYTNAAEAEALVRGLAPLVSGVKNVEVAVCPPFPYLIPVAKALQGTQVRVGGQNMHWEDEGAFTGEVSPRMLTDAGCRFVILGHSERRQFFGETDEKINKKIKKALSSGLTPIVCVGEMLAEREAGTTEKIIRGQLEGCFQSLTPGDMVKLVIAYEPVWAIGTGKTASPEQAQDVHRFIRAWLSGAFGKDTAESIRIQYGGSVKPDNAKALMSQPDIDGALVGGASLKADGFAAIVRAAEQ